MRNCCPGSASSASSTPRVASPRQDIVLLVVGPIGAENLSFGTLATHVQMPDNSTSTLNGPDLAKSVRFLEITPPSIDKQVFLIVPSQLDGEEITEGTIIQRVKEYLSDNRQDYPYVDHVLYFKETKAHYNIQLEPVSSYRSALRDICNASDSTLHEKVSLVKTVGDESGIPGRWKPLSKAQQFTFEVTENSALDIVRKIVARN
ncbi:hypothetical protein P691DRAFT_802502 [Macrolepiota fuliginosa MF-IS2]|uniref:Uncharacterized protein n=1 Tax=Macrolepiota fuliginosa MF-IS2 TaxID=1400762 RepID=A0A9P5XCB6_9AGAR|nr:hypothetical protein P691DRAFT_802502 [Macrolepiota fuliginosa MF-IS2]